MRSVALTIGILFTRMYPSGDLLEAPWFIQLLVVSVMVQSMWLDWAQYGASRSWRVRAHDAGRLQMARSGKELA